MYLSAFTAKKYFNFWTIALITVKISFVHAAVLSRYTLIKCTVDSSCSRLRGFFDDTRVDY